MTNYEKLKQLCKDQDRGVYTSYFNHRTSVTVTEPNDAGAAWDSIGGTDSVEEYARLMICVMSPMKVVK